MCVKQTHVKETGIEHMFVCVCDAVLAQAGLGATRDSVYAGHVCRKGVRRVGAETHWV